MSVRTLSVGVISLALIAFNGCALVSGVDELIGTRSAKARMLSESAQKFHKSLAWGDVAEASEHVAIDAQADFSEKVLGPMEEKKIIDCEIKRIEYLPTAEDEAHIEATVRYFRVPQMLVQTRTTREKWQYVRFDGGWRLVDAEEVVPPIPAPRKITNLSQ